MHFKHPELLYALFLLIIPILIHLFQLRRFEKVTFTNVKFLQAVKLQTRKSSQIKKWITLFTRMLLLTCIVLAFAQPFIPKTTAFDKAQETVIYLDNSFSMQAKGRNGSLFNEAVQDIINSIPETESISLYTNTETFRNTSLKTLKKDLIQLEFAPNQLSYEAAYLKGKQLFLDQGDTSKHLILVSDFQQQTKALQFEADSTVQVTLVQPQINDRSNISIDSVYISNTSAKTIELTVTLSNQNTPVDNVSVALYNDDILSSKSAIALDKEAEVIFTMPYNEEINGRLSIEDSGLEFDNSFYFNTNAKPKIKVLAINEDAEDAFLKRIYTNDEFDYQSAALDRLNYKLILDQNLIVLNELSSIPKALTEALINFTKNSGKLLIIPKDEININSYNQLLKNTNLNPYAHIKKQDKRVTKIHYSHPLLKNTFYNKVSNFQYPKVEHTQQFTSNSSAVLSYEDGTAFLMGNSENYVFASPLNQSNSNFKNSQLIVPVLYNIGLQSLNLSKLFYTIGEANSIAIPTSIGQDDILTLADAESAVIPLQKTYSKTVVLETGEFPNTAGILEVKNKNKVIQKLSFNYDRAESQLNYYDLNALENVSLASRLETTINNIKSQANVNALWKWFVIFALAFLIIEMLLLKYLK
ncbi:BatA domain-containing protein [Winogradskyella arenosi]|uniref:Putative membrane protein (TIGR02226 family) n=1 Tax=Winogradskyella arenosi TaxID=533325 RepID=A0A368ZIF7_9FLAO|nr:BatA domain-containing protein [Winogradskyella arenosi]RCW92629.1 putative membrane protein (TIGR02226 family) [Winogradskyella arenosi]